MKNQSNPTEVRNKRFHMLVDKINLTRNGILSHDLGGGLSLSFYILVSVAVIWPRYFYLKIPGLPGISIFSVYSVIFFLLFLPFAVFARGALEPFLQVIRRSLALWIIFISFILWRLITSAIGSPIGGEDPWVAFSRLFIPISVYFFISTVMMLDRNIYRSTFRIMTILIIIVSIGAYIEVESNQRLLRLFGLSEYAAGGYLVDSFMSTFYRYNNLRAQSVFTQPLVMGQFMATLSPLCLALAFNEKKLWRMIAILAFFASLYGLLLSTARSGLISGIVSGLTFLILISVNRYRYRWLFLWFAAALLIMAIISAFQLGDFIADVVGHTGENLQSAHFRKVMVSQTFISAAESPIFGYGDGTSKYIAGIIDTNSSQRATIDSLYLSILLQNGYPGLFLWCAFFVVLILMAVRNALEGGSGATRTINSAIAACFAGLAVGFSVLSIEDNMVIVYLLSGVVMVDRQTTRSAAGNLGQAVF